MRSLSVRSMVWIFVVASSVSLASAGFDPAEPVGIRDLKQTVEATSYLAEDPELALLNLGVRVKDRVATLWGPVPTAELSFKAEVRLRSLNGLLEVNNEMFILEETATVRSPFAPAPVPVRSPDSLPPALPTPPLETPRINTPPIETPRPKVPSLAPPRPQTVQLSLEPITVHYPPTKEGETVREPREVAVSPVLSSLEKLRAADERFRGIQWTVQATRILLRGTEVSPEAMQEFARRVSRIPGVERVTLEESR